MKLNLKSTIAAPADNNSCQKALNGIIGNTRRGIVVDKTLDPDSNNPVANKPVSTALAALAGKVDAALQKPTGMTKTKLVGVGTNGQENIEIGDNLTLANGKLSATGGGSGGDAFDIISSTDLSTYTGNITGTKPVLLNIYDMQYYLFTGLNTYPDTVANASVITPTEAGIRVSIMTAKNGQLTMNSIDYPMPFSYFSHFITLTNGNDRIYFQCVTGNDDPLNTEALKNFLYRKKSICTGVLGNSAETLATPLFVTGENEELRVYYVLKNDTSGTISSKSVTSFASSDSIAEIG